MADDELALTDSHRRRIGVLSGGMRELLDELRRSGVTKESTAEVELGIAELERGSELALRSRGDVVGAALTRLRTPD